MKQVAVLIAIALLLFAGCKEPEPEEPPPPPPKTPQEILSGIRSAVDQAVNAAPQGVRPTEESRAEVQSKVRAELQKYMTEENREEGITLAAQSIEQQVAAAEEEMDWYRMVYLCDAAMTIRSNPRIERYLERAMFQVNKPEVAITGITTLDNTPYFHVNVFLPETNELHKLNVREGDEFFDLRFVEIIGRNRGMRLEYLKDNSIFEVEGP